LLVRPIEFEARLRRTEHSPLLTQAQMKFLTLNLDFSINKAKRVLGYRPNVDFQQGIVAALDDINGKNAAAEPKSVVAAA
jgi:nucleoside-diphosphate-sugar epimerase